MATRKSRPPRPARRPHGLAGLVAESAAMRRVILQATRIAASRAPLLITGEPGSGKTRLARAIHDSGPRAGGPFALVACSAIRAEEAEDQLFGVAEAAGDARPGGFDAADGGSLLVHEVVALGAPAQAALLRALHERRHLPRGAREPHRTDVRVIATTTHDLAAEAAAGRFRADLAERLGVVRIDVPPLRERGEDLPALVEQLIADIQRAHDRRRRRITPGALERLAAQQWPGNVSELRSTLERMLVAAAGRGPLTVSDVPAARASAAPAGAVEVAVGMTMAEVERRLIWATLAHTGFDKRRAAALLGIGLRTLYRKIREFRL